MSYQQNLKSFHFVKEKINEYEVITISFLVYKRWKRETVTEM